jgi:hypothetical protein
VTLGSPLRLPHCHTSLLDSCYFAGAAAGNV